MKGLEVTFAQPLSVGTHGVTPGKIIGDHQGIFAFLMLQCYDAKKGTIVLRSDYLIWEGMGRYKDILLFYSCAPDEAVLEIGKARVVKIVDLETNEVIYQNP
ncbi:MAG: hypothetical protein AAB389_04525, partial [Patescibacteria group bacterium]